MKITQLTQEECQQGLTPFFETVAKKAGIHVSERTQFDCAKMRVTKSVQDEFYAYYREEGYTSETITQLLLLYGPKANLTADIEYAAAIEKDFVKEKL